MKILAITNLFPNSIEPTRGMFNFQQFKALASLSGVEIKVVAPVPWFPRLKIKKEWYNFSLIPKNEMISGFEVYHPRYVIIPKILRLLDGLVFFFGVVRTVKEIQKKFLFDCILATWAYPDGFGSALIAQMFKKPFFIKVHGSDVDVHIKSWFRKKMIAYALQKSTKIISVSQNLKEKMASLGIAKDKIIVIPNGIDTELFKPLDQIECRKTLGLPLDKKMILYVGNLKRDKGVIDLADAFSQLSRENTIDAILVIVGDGPLKEELEKKAADLSLLPSSIFLAANRPHAEIPIWMNTTDVFCLPSYHEGCPNVILEALACSKPVVATNVGTIPEMIPSEDIGILVKPNRPDLLMQALVKSLNKNWDCQEIRGKRLSFNWIENAEMLNKLLTSSASLVREAKRPALRMLLKHFAAQIIPRQVIVWKGRKCVNKNIALTFDDGPNPTFTPAVLDILKEKSTRATFFLIGEYAEKNRALTKRITQEGHSIGMHSYTHSAYKSMTDTGKKSEIVRSRHILQEIAGINTNLFRPPQGSLSISQLRYCLRENITTVLWSIDSLDFKNKDVKDIVASAVANGIRGGDIILFHDDNEATVTALPKVIDHFQNAGFEFVTVEEMIQ